MYFERLEIRGFKSFVDRTVITFKPGITAIIGPNGCGKSNISDAIRWALGEQNVRNLRGIRVNDLIFNGTNKRKALGMAEVTLTVNNTGDLSKAINGQIEVKRRIFRNGDSEFYINKIPCRLKDIVELFMDSGLGKGSYSLIEQGKVDMILSNKPRERRVLLEEAAGIVRYKVRKEEALRKFADTQNNLIRIEDRLYELDTQAESLKKQARRARRFLSQRDQLIHLERNIASYKLLLMEEKQDKLNEQRVKLDDKLTKYESDLSRGIVYKEEREQELEKVRAALNKHHTEKNRFENEIELIFQDNRYSRTRIDELDLEAENLEFEIDELLEKKDQAQLDFEEEEAESITISKQVIDLETQLSQLQAKQSETIEELDEKVRQREIAGREYLKLISRNAQLKQQREKYKFRCEEIENRQNRLNHEQEETLRQKERLKPHLLYLRENEQTLKEQAEQLNENIMETLEERVAKEEENQELEKKLNILNEKLHRADARLQSLQEMEASLEGYSAGVKYVFELIEKEPILDYKCSLLLDHIKTEDKYSKIIAQALSNFIETIIVPSKQAALEIIHLLKEKEISASVSLFPLDSIIVEQNFSKKEFSELDYMQTNENLAQHCIYDSEGEAFLKQYLETFIIVDSLQQGYLFAEKNNAFHSYISAEGNILWKDGSISTCGTQDRAVELFSRKHEITQLSNEITELKDNYHSLFHKIEETKEIIKNIQLHLEEEEEKYNETRLSLQDVKKDCEMVEKQIDRFEEILLTVALELEHLGLDLETNLKEAETISLQISSFEKELETLQEENAIWEQQVEELKSIKEKQQSELTECQVKLASLRERVARFKKSLENRQLMIDEYNHTIEKNRQRKKEGQEQKETLADKIEKNEDKLEKNRYELSVTLTVIEELTEKYDELKEQIQKDEEWERIVNRTMKPLQEEFNNIKLELTSLEVELQHLYNEIENRLKSNSDEIRNNSEMPKDEDAANRLQKKIQLIKKRLADFDNVNLAAPEQYSALTDKIETMQGQRQDVVDAIDTLQKTIKKIDSESEQRLLNCFHTVNRNFKDLFERLFGGGYAELQFENEHQPLESGITIIAQPPGKKLQSISLFSGGEKTLTAIALLIAIFYYKPSPFCFMDEVDAALDEINTDRFSWLLQEISQKAQIIMVTHSRKTIEIADVFYGVTMSDPGISKVISLKLDQNSNRLSA